MGFSIHILSASDPEWESWLTPLKGDFQHSSGYHRLAESYGEGRGYLAVYGSRERYLAWPYLLRPVVAGATQDPTPYSDVTSVYGYPGPLGYNCASGDTFLEQAWEAMQDVWSSQHAVCAFTRFNPLFSNQKLIPGSARKGLVLSGATVSIDLTKTDDERWREYKRQLQQHIRRGRDIGLTVEFDPDWKYLEEFERIYSSTMRRNAASPYYFFTHDYFLTMKAELGNHGMLAVSRLGDQIICACLIMEYGGFVNTHLAGTVDAYLALSPFKTIVHELTSYAKQRGNHSIHLGGGRAGKQDSLFRFKTEFSPRHHEFYTGRWILRQNIYDELSDGCTTDFFPAYRAPGLDPAAQSAAVAAC